MSQNRKEKGNVPNLRFPEFTGEWKRKTLGDIAVIIGGGTPNTKIAEYWNGDIQWFTVSEIKSNYVSKSKRTITELGLSKSSAKLLPIGAILITTCGTIGEVAIATEECTTNQGFQSLIVDKDTDNIFIANWIKQNKGELIRRAKGSIFAEISKSEIERIPIILSSNPDEQIKIANLLCLLDDRIATQNKIIEELETLAKELSSKLFLQKLRFKSSDGNNFPDWGYVNLKSMGTFMRGLTYGSENVSNEGLLVLRSSNIQNNTLLLDKDIIFVDKDCSENLLLQRGDIVICMSNGSKSLVGKMLNILAIILTL